MSGKSFHRITRFDLFNVCVFLFVDKNKINFTEHSDGIFFTTFLRILKRFINKEIDKVYLFAHFRMHNSTNLFLNESHYTLRLIRIDHIFS